MTAPARTGPSPSGGGPTAFLLLSPRHIRMLRLAANGHTDQQIATQLGLSIHTIRENWARWIRPRLHAVDRTHAVAIAVATGLVQPHEVRPYGRERA